MASFTTLVEGVSERHDQNATGVSAGAHTRRRPAVAFQTINATSTVTAIDRARCLVLRPLLSAVQVVSNLVIFRILERVNTAFLCLKLTGQRTVGCCGVHEARMWLTTVTNLCSNPASKPPI